MCRPNSLVPGGSKAGYNTSDGANGQGDQGALVRFGPFAAFGKVVNGCRSKSAAKPSADIRLILETA
jgi:hypothetical protein